MVDVAVPGGPGNVDRRGYAYANLTNVSDSDFAAKAAEAGVGGDATAQATLGNPVGLSQLGARPGADIAAALKAAIEHPTLKYFTLEPGSYDCSSVFTADMVCDKHFTARGAEIRWIGTGDAAVSGSLLEINPGYEWIESVTVPPGTIANPSAVEAGILGPDNTGITRYSKLLLANARPVTPADKLKVVADDVLWHSLWGGSPTRYRRVGETAVPGEENTADPTVIKLTGVLGDRYTQGVQVFKYKDLEFSWDGGTFTVDPAAVTASWNLNAIFKFTLMRGGDLRNIKIDRALIPIVDLLGCEGWTGDNIRYRYGRTVSTEHELAYVFNLTHSENCTFSNVNAQQHRHAWTDNANYSSAGTDYEARGRSRNNLILNFRGTGGQNATADGHPEGENNKAVNCFSSGTFEGPSSGGPAFNQRGIGYSHINCHAVGDYRGFRMACQTGGRITGGSARRIWDKALEFTLDSGSGSIFWAQSLDNRVNSEGPFEVVGPGNACANCGDEDYLTSATVSAVNTATDTITHGLNTTFPGQLVTFSGTGLPAPLVAGTEYFVIWTDDSNCKLAATYNDALAGVAIDLTTTGSGTITILNDARPHVDISNAVLRVASVGDCGAVFHLRGVYLRGRNVTIDLSDYVASSVSGFATIFYAFTSNNDVEIDGLTIIPPAVWGPLNAVAALMDASGAGNTSRIIVRNISYVGRKDFQAATTPGGNLFGITANMTGEVRASGTKTVGASTMISNKILTNSTAIEIGYIEADNIEVISTTTATAAVTIASALTSTGVGRQRDGVTIKYKQVAASGTRTVNAVALTTGQQAEFVYRTTGGASTLTHMVPV